MLKGNEHRKSPRRKIVKRKAVLSTKMFTSRKKNANLNLIEPLKNSLCGHIKKHFM
jgi:hypothetical protein